MDRLQKPPLFIGQSALQVGESLILDIYGIDPIADDYIRPRDSARYTFTNLQISVDTTSGIYFPPGYPIVLIHPTTKDVVECMVVNSSIISPTLVSVVLKSKDSTLGSLDTTWKVIPSTTIDWAQSIEECKPPRDLRSTFIERTTSRLMWTAGFAAEETTIRVKARTDSSWTIYKLGGSDQRLDLKNLSANTTYDWQITSKCSNTKSIFYSDVMTFETKP